MLGSLDFSSEDGEDGLMKAMSGMMDQLLSKDVLYPSLVDLCAQYPEWLASHRDEISAEDLARYGRQLEVMRAICGEFEAERERDSGEVKHARTERILQLMQQVSGVDKYVLYPHNIIIIVCHLSFIFYRFTAVA